MLALLVHASTGFAPVPDDCPADNRLSKPEIKATFPTPLSKESAASPEVASWFVDNVASIPMAGPPAMTARQIELAKMTAQEFMAARAAGSVTCVEYAEVLTMRAKHYKYMGQFMYWDNMPDQMDVVMAAAAALDAMVNTVTAAATLRFALSITAPAAHHRLPSRASTPLHRSTASPCP